MNPPVIILDDGYGKFYVCAEDYRRSYSLYKIALGTTDLKQAIEFFQQLRDDIEENGLCSWDDRIRRSSRTGPDGPRVVAGQPYSTTENHHEHDTKPRLP